MAEARTITKQLGGAEDLVLGVGTVLQTRGGNNLDITKLNATELQGSLVVGTIAELNALVVADIGSTKTVFVHEDGVTYKHNGVSWEDSTIRRLEIQAEEETLADLRSMTTLPSTVYVTGHTIANDKAFGSNFFKLMGVTGKVDNNGTIIVVTIETVEYVYELQYDGAINVKWFGAAGDNIVNDRDAIYTAIKYTGQTAHSKVWFPPSTGYKLSGAGSYMNFTIADLPNGVEIDFNNQVINSEVTRLTDGSQGDAFATNYGLFTFTGTEGTIYEANSGASILSAPVVSLPEPVTHSLVVGDYVWIRAIDPLDAGSGLFKWMPINRLHRLDKISGGKFYFDGRFEFDIPLNSTIKYKKVEQMKNVVIKNLHATDNSAYDTINKNNGLSLVVFQRCVNCTTENIESYYFPEHTVSCVISSRIKIGKGNLYDPKETVQGGYFTQLLQSSHITVGKISGRNERHIVDVTASAYVSIKESGSLTTENATFTTHGSFEHNIHYLDCYGYMSMANSGLDYGSSTRYIDIENHEGTNLNTGQNAYQGVSDVSIRNSRFPAISYINLDGVEISDCIFSQLTYFAENSTRSGKRNRFENVTFTNLAPDSLDSTSGNVHNPVSVARTEFYMCTINYTTPPTINVGEHRFIGGEINTSGIPVLATKVTFDNTNINSATTSGVSHLDISADAYFINSKISNFGTLFTGTSDQVVQFNGGTMVFPNPSVSESCWSSTKTSGVLKLKIDSVEADRNNVASRIFTFSTVGAVLNMSVTGNTFTDGDIRLDAGLWAAVKNSLVYTGNTEDAITITARPVTGTSTVVENNAVI